MVNARRGKDQLGTKSQIPTNFARGAPRRREFGKRVGDSLQVCLGLYHARIISLDFPLHRSSQNVAG
jgi:hypothetical protein